MGFATGYRLVATWHRYPLEIIIVWKVIYHNKSEIRKGSSYINGQQIVL